NSVRLLATLSANMGVAIENARLFQETRRLLEQTEQRSAEMAIINSVQQGLAAQLDMQASFDLVGDKLHEIFDVDVVDIGLYDLEKDLIRDGYGIERGVRLPSWGTYAPYGFRRHVIETREPLVINEDAVQRGAEFGNPTVIGEAAKSLVFMPMVVGDEVKGHISLQDLDREHAFSESDVRLLSTLASSMAVALENTRLFDETRRLLEQTEQRSAELA